MFWQTHEVTERYLDEHESDIGGWELPAGTLKFEWDEINLGHLPGQWARREVP